MENKKGLFGFVSYFLPIKLLLFFNSYIIFSLLGKGKSGTYVFLGVAAVLIIGYGSAYLSGKFSKRNNAYGGLIIFLALAILFFVNKIYFIVLFFSLWFLAYFASESEILHRLHKRYNYSYGYMLVVSAIPLAVNLLPQTSFSLSYNLVYLAQIVLSVLFAVQRRKGEVVMEVHVDQGSPKALLVIGLGAIILSSALLMWGFKDIGGEGSIFPVLFLFVFYVGGAVALNSYILSKLEEKKKN